MVFGNDLLKTKSAVPFTWWYFIFSIQPSISFAAISFNGSAMMA